MEISSLRQSDFTTLSSIEPIKNNPIVTQSSTNDNSNLINKNASDYFDLGVDINSFIKVDTIQNQTNKELIGYLTSIMDNESIEGKKNLKAYSVSPFTINFLDFQKDLEKMGGLKYLNSIVSQMDENIKKWNQDKYIPLEVNKDLTTPKASSLLRAVAEGKLGVGVHYFDTFKELTKKEVEILNIKKFKNLYSFSEEFAQTQGFKDLYQQYKKQRLDEAIKFIDSGKDYYKENGVKSIITSDVVSKSLSKSEVIEYYTGVSNNLKDKLEGNLKKPELSKSFMHKNMRDAINLYDKITSDLKNMWGYGDLDIHT